MMAGEKGYTPLEKIGCALLFATGKFCSYLLPRRFTIISMEDTFLYALKHVVTSARTSKWLTQLREFDYIITTKHTTRASLADTLTHRVFEKKVKLPKPPSDEAKVMTLKDAYTLHFDGAFRRILGRAAACIVIADPFGNKVHQEGLHLPEAPTMKQSMQHW